MNLFRLAVAAAALGGMAVGTQALAQDRMMAPRQGPVAGHGGSPGHGWSDHRGRHGGDWRGRRGHRGNWGWRGRDRYDGGIGFYLDVGDLSVGDEPRRDLFGFYGAGGTVRNVNGKPVYDYDRSYPYDYYGGEPVEAPRRSYARSSSCEVQMVPDDRGGRAPVRICRN